MITIIFADQVQDLNKKANENSVTRARAELPERSGRGVAERHVGPAGTAGAEWGAAAGSVGRPTRDGCGPEALAAGCGMVSGTTDATVTLVTGCEMVSGTTDCDREGTERGGGKYCMARGTAAGLSS